jgi:hypothetical protein
MGKTSFAGGNYSPAAYGFDKPVARLAEDFFMGYIGETTRQSHEHIPGIQSGSSEMQIRGLGLQDGLEEQTDSNAS